METLNVKKNRKQILGVERSLLLAHSHPHPRRACVSVTWRESLPKWHSSTERQQKQHMKRTFAQNVDAVVAGTNSALRLALLSEWNFYALGSWRYLQLRSRQTHTHWWSSTPASEYQIHAMKTSHSMLDYTKKQLQIMRKIINFPLVKRNMAAIYDTMLFSIFPTCIHVISEPVYLDCCQFCRSLALNPKRSYAQISHV